MVMQHQLRQQNLHFLNGSAFLGQEYNCMVYVCVCIILKPISSK